MKNVSHKKKWNAGLLQLHVDPPPITLIKGENDDNSKMFFVEMKLRRYPTSENSDLSEFKMALFYNDYREDVFVRS